VLVLKDQKGAKSQEPKDCGDSQRFMVFPEFIRKLKPNIANSPDQVMMADPSIVQSNSM
jgi:hypothetical protein